MGDDVFMEPPHGENTEQESCEDISRIMNSSDYTGQESDYEEKKKCHSNRYREGKCEESCKKCTPEDSMP